MVKYNKKKQPKKQPLKVQSQKDLTSIESQDLLQAYMRAVEKHPLLSKEEEERLAKLYYETKNPDIAKALVLAHLRFVVKIAMQYARSGAKIMDVIQEGNTGLMKAVHSFDPFKNNRLISYAVWWIRGEIMSYLLKNHSVVEVGSSQQQKKLFYHLQKAIDEVSNNSGTLLLNKKQIKDVQTKVQISPKKLKNSLGHVLHKDISLSHTHGDSEVTLESLLKTNSISSEEEIILQEKKNALQKSLEKLQPSLSEKECMILEKRLIANTPQSLQQIADHFSVTREAIRQAENRLIKKIKSGLG